MNGPILKSPEKLSPQTRRKAPFRLLSVLMARCPACHQGSILRSVFWINERCPHCGHDFHPEPGFFLGAMAISFILTGILTVPPMVILKMMKVDMAILIAFPFIEFLFVGSFLMIYSRVLWLHLEYRLTSRLHDGYQGHRE